MAFFFFLQLNPWGIVCHPSASYLALQWDSGIVVLEWLHPCQQCTFMQDITCLDFLQFQHLLFFKKKKKVQNWSDCHGGLKQYSIPDCKDKKAECNSCYAPQKQQQQKITNKEIKTFIQHQFYNSKHFFIFCFFIEYRFLENAYQILFPLFPLYFPPHHTLKSVPLHFLFRRE